MTYARDRKKLATEQALGVQGVSGMIVQAALLRKQALFASQSLWKIDNALCCFMFHVASCGKPEGEHMKLTPDADQYPDGAQVTYTCLPPYTAKTDRELRCLKGRWSGKVECTRKYSLVQKLYLMYCIFGLLFCL